MASHPQLDGLLADLWDGKIDRRRFVTRAAMLGLPLSAAGVLARSRRAYAQGEGPGQTIRSITREEYGAQIREKFGFAEPTAQGGTLILGDATDISGVNPLLMGDAPTNDLFLGHVFERLVSAGAVDGSPAPELADRWEIAPDGVTYTFFLNPAATFHDGSPVTADDVVFSIERRLDPATGGQYQSSVALYVESFRAVDPLTVEVRSRGVQATFLLNFGLYVPIIRRALWEGVPAADWPTDPGSTGQPPEQAAERVVGSGPFTFAEWVQGDHVTLARNERYWNTVSSRVPALDEVILRVLPDDAALAQAVRTGEIDLYDRVTPGEVESLANEDAIDVAVYDGFSFNFYFTNLDPARTTLFADVRVRRALFLALDRQAIVDAIHLGFGVVAQGTQPVLSPAYAPDQIRTTYGYDPAQAAQLLAEAGWLPGDDGILERDGQRFAFEILAAEGSSTNEQTLAYMQEAWRDLGIDAQPTFTQFPVLLDIINQTHDYQIIYVGFSWDPTGDQESMFRCASYEGGFNSARYCNPEWDRLNELQQRELDPERRRQLLIEQSNLANDDLPVGIINFRKERTAYRTRLKNYAADGFTAYYWCWPFVYVEN